MRIRNKIARLAAAALVAGAAVLAVGLASRAPGQAATPVEIVGQGSGKCLDVRREDGRTVQTWACFGSPNQRWFVQLAGTFSGIDYFRFVSADVPTQCMTVHGGGFANGTPVDVEDCGG